MKPRFLDCTLDDPSRNLAMEEVLFLLCDTPVVRVWDNQRSVVLGRAQLVQAETDLDYCSAQGIPVVRRFTAGGTVYNGPGNVNWTFAVTKKSGPPLSFSQDAKKVFESFALVVVDALNTCSVRARFDPPNRLLDGAGNKISGMAAYISNRALICHGTLLLDADLSELERTTGRDHGPRAAKYPRSIHANVANCWADREKFVSALAKAAGADYDGSEPTKEEFETTERLYSQKYGSRAWNEGDPFGLDYAQFLPSLLESSDREV